eukprot:3931791-Rhodomonas_salina.1
MAVMPCPTTALTCLGVGPVRASSYATTTSPIQTDPAPPWQAMTGKLRVPDLPTHAIRLPQN